MKYLKEYNIHSKTFTQISIGESNKISDQMLEFTDAEMDIIKDIYSDDSLYEFTEDPNNKITIDIRLIYLSNDECDPCININKLPDEWYYIQFQNENVNINRSIYYKCDQMSGLKDCLIMLKNKYNLI